MENKDVIFFPLNFPETLNSTHGPWPPAVSHCPLLVTVLSSGLKTKSGLWSRGHEVTRSSLCRHSLYLLKNPPLIRVRSLEEETQVAAGLRAAVCGFDHPETEPGTCSSPLHPRGISRVLFLYCPAKNIRSLTLEVLSLDQQHPFCLRTC